MVCQVVTLKIIVYYCEIQNDMLYHIELCTIYVNFPLKCDSVLTKSSLIELINLHCQFHNEKSLIWEV